MVSIYIFRIPLLQLTKVLCFPFWLQADSDDDLVGDTCDDNIDRWAVYVRQG